MTDHPTNPRVTVTQPQSQQQHPRSVILDRQNQNSRYNIRPASVARFPSPSNERQQPQQQQRSASTRSPSMARNSPSKTSEKPVSVPPTCTASSASFGGTSARSCKSKDEAILSDAAKRGQRRLSSRILTEIDSPSPSEACSRPPSRAATMGHFQAAATSAAVPVKSNGMPTTTATDTSSKPTRQHHLGSVTDAGARPKTTITGMPLDGGGSREVGLRLPAFPESSRPNSKVLTSFPFPHPTTPSGSKMLGDGSYNDGDGSANGDRRLSLHCITKPLHTVGGWIDKATNIFAGPYERRLLNEEAEDDALTRQIVDRLKSGQGVIPASQRNSLAEPLVLPPPKGSGGSGDDKAGASTSAGTGTYGTFSVPQSQAQGQLQQQAQRVSYLSKMMTSSTSTSLSDADPSDPYGYRRLAGPVLLPSYNADLATRRRERRRARSRARFQCMALWTIWTVSIVLVLLVIGSGATVWKD